MQINLRQSEIENAVKQYIHAQGINLTGKHVELNFTAGRGDRGLSVDIDINEAGAKPEGQQNLAKVRHEAPAPQPTANPPTVIEERERVPEAAEGTTDSSLFG